MKKLWQKNSTTLDTAIEYFETKDDLLLDQKLVKYDVLGSIAQAKMLSKIGIITVKELLDVVKGLTKILDLNEKGQFILEAGDEDVHTKIENYLTENYGEVGKKIHTGRSRNDQVLTAIRLYSKDQLLLVWQKIIDLEKSFISLAKEYQDIPMPGYTHHQKAMPSTVGLWALAFVESLQNDIKSIISSYELNNQSPLGSAAAFGVPLNLDREYSSKLLNFSKVQINPIYCQNSRGKIEAELLSSLVQILSTINKFASDIVFFTSSELDYFNLSSSLYSGSSIMPQKKNIDIAELLKSKVHLVLGFYTQIVSLSSNLPSGYNRDLQDSKKPLMESFEITLNALMATDILVKNITPNKDKLIKSMTPQLFATHKVFELVKKGMPFREAYQKIGENINDVKVSEIDKLLKLSTHLGGTANLGINLFEKQVRNDIEIFKKSSNDFKKAVQKLVKKEDKVK